MSVRGNGDFRHAVMGKARYSAKSGTIVTPSRLRRPSGSSLFDFLENVMEAYILDWLNLLVRWFHMIAGIAW
ncbi:MAG: hypothetical protein ACHQIO_16220, partial [Nevskiales bacterium]